MKPALFLVSLVWLSEPAWAIAPNSSHGSVSVATGDTLWRIATRVRPDDSVAMVQVIYALVQANSQVLKANALHQLPSGSTLGVPSRQLMLRTPVEQARQWYYDAVSRPDTATKTKVTSQPDNPANAVNALVQSSAAPKANAERGVTTNRPAPPLPDTSSTTTATAAPPANSAAAKDSWHQQVQADYSLELQQRYYPQQAAQGQPTHYSSLAFSAQWYWQSDDRSQQWAFEPYLRWDQRDNERSRIDLRQAYWQYVGDGFDVKAGLDIVFWGVTESQHLVDVINQTDLLANIDAETKLGQPMLNWNLHGDAGSLALYLLPYFRERPFAGEDGRLRLPIPVDSSDPLYESAKGDKNLDFALRYSQRFGTLDLGLSYFEGNNREPIFISSDNGQLQPLYLQMQQLGLDSLWVSGNWLWKLETIYRKTRQQDFVAATAGFEYTRVGIFSSDWDLGWIAEYQYDSRGEQASSVGQNDLFIGTRFAANDIAGTELLLGVLQDLDYSNSQSVKLEASMRLSNSVRLRLDAWLFNSEQPTEPLYWLRRDDYLQLSLDYYF